MHRILMQRRQNAFYDSNLGAQATYCGQYGKQIDDDSRFCRFCEATPMPLK